MANLINKQNLHSVLDGTEQEIRDLLSEFYSLDATNAGISSCLAVCAGLLELSKHLLERVEEIEKEVANLNDRTLSQVFVGTPLAGVDNTPSNKTIMDLTYYGGV